MSSISSYHDLVEESTIKYFQNNGYKVIKFTYHSFEEIDFIKNCDTYECLFIRTLPDLFIMKEEKSSFIEVKSKSPQYPNLALELFPLMVNYHLATHLGINIFYVFGSGEKPESCELYCLKIDKVIPLIDRVILTDKFEDRVTEELKRFSVDVLNIQPELKMKETIIKRRSANENVGSGDPFAIISEKNLSCFKRLQ